MLKSNEKRESEQKRRDLTGEHPAGDAGQIILFFLFIVVWVSDTFFLEYSTFLNSFISNKLRIPLAVILLLSSLIFARKGLAIVFGEEKEKPTVIRKGVFNLIRHPIYLSEILFYLSMLFFSVSLASTAICLIIIGFLHFISRLEEKLLLQRFGEEYETYMREVPMWIPRITKKSKVT
jgi:protein-S-isoprenylcysteine O-methyltransferase Ste14